MKESIEMPKGIFYIIVAICAAIIMFTSLDMILRTKDLDLFNMWSLNPNIINKFSGESTEQLYSTYIQMNLSIFIIRVVTPMAVAIHTYYTFTKLRVNKLYVVLWLLILIGSFLMSSLGEPYYSIFFILSGIGYLGLVLVMLSLGKSINNLRSL